ncbi:MAG TPA: prepilin-type N-terminal cleavage/methylation domain-containing protein [Actinomycetota bacterium]|nr:prepilin-type N-terminal cleavage/methylation domain-containing protein [Actinomycetota bacterium]
MGERQRQDGFTLVELLVVVVIISILAAIAIPIYLRQREKGWTAQVQSSLKNAATAIEAWAVDNGGDFTSLNGADASVLEPQGFHMPTWASSPGYITIVANGTRYCIQAQHSQMSTSAAWRRSTYDSAIGEPKSDPDTCPTL